MFPKFRPGALLSRGAMAIALGTAALTAAAVALPAQAAEKKPAGAPKLALTKPFIAVAGPFEKAVADAGKRADVVAAGAKVTAATDAYNAARGSAARKTTAAQRDAAIAELQAALATERGMVEPMFAAATAPDDKFMAGNLLVKLAALSQDLPMVRRGYEAMLGSGKYPAADVPRLQSALGTICYDTKDYACAQTNLAAALAGGFSNGNTEVVLADSYIKGGQVQTGIDSLWKSIQTAKAAGKPVPAEWYGTGLNAAFRAKMADKASIFSRAMVTDYPTAANWGSAVNALRYLNAYEPQEKMDLMRLMSRTNSMAEGTDFVEFIQTADKLRLPAEELAALDAGLKAGKLQTSDVFVTEARTTATRQVGEEKPTLAGLEQRGLAAGSTGVAAAATADALLSYGQPAKAEALYLVAMQKGGVDTQRILTRLGIAQADQGKWADAQTTFAKVTGLRQPIAQLWGIYVAQKAKGG